MAKPAGMMREWTKWNPKIVAIVAIICWISALMMAILSLHVGPIAAKILSLSALGIIILLFLSILFAAFMIVLWPKDGKPKVG